ncbi:HEAT repeat domain-containing protein [Exiguobacterium sp.]|uniref:HEAT repeat domain-containing protein n=1 Tax=Exiguobacterium sp. TaxID=44751 RepID=UPI0028AF2CB4|nr:HEAT repeat domain-containing protein [Exiguobacterium sp.]
MKDDEILYLVEQMSEEKYFYQEESKCYTNEGSSSDTAYEKVRHFKDANMLPRLNTLLDKVKQAEQKQHLYFMIGTIGENSGDVRAGVLLLEKLEQETKPSLLESILEEIAKQRCIHNTERIVKYIDDSRSSVREAAIQALRVCRDEIAEDALIRLITTSNNSFDIMSANFVLATIGTERAISYLIPLLDHSRGDVRHSALAALSELNNGLDLSIFLRALKDRSGTVREYALIAIEQHGDEVAIEPVIKRLQTLLKRMRQIQTDEVLIAFRFLYRYQHSHQAISKLFYWIIQTKRGVLFDEEWQWLENHFTCS